MTYICQFDSMTCMNLIRTSLRIEAPLKKGAEELALRNNITLQKVMNDSLRAYLSGQAQKKAKKIVFQSRDLGINVDNLTREDYYADR